MCGFVGFIDLKKSTRVERLNNLINLMTDRIIWRGPDSKGIWSNAKNGIALGHRRLSVIDLSNHGHQPMLSNCGSYVLAYNGEVYNFIEIRHKLRKEGVKFKSESDTEVVLEACLNWGVQRALRQFNGMFSFAFWDIKNERLTLARDRLGIKPLYWGKCSETIFFGSQPSTFEKHPNWNGEINKSSVASFLRHNYVPSPNSIYSNVQKLMPGHFLEIQKGKVISNQSYWHLDILSQKSNASSNISENEALEQFSVLLSNSIKSQMVADVPLGAFLSGGIDSSLVVALMQEHSANKIKTFSVGFENKNYDESDFAQQVAENLKTDHHKLTLNSKTAFECIEKIPEWFDEPFADSSQIPTYFVSKMARKEVTVVLSGDGGDELFAGYNRYFWANKIWKNIRYIPYATRNLSAQLIKSLPHDQWDALGQFASKFVEIKQLGNKAHKAADILSLRSSDEIYLNLISQWKDPSSVMLDGFEHYSQIRYFSDQIPNSTLMTKMQYLDLKTYLPDDILTKVDRSSMAVSLEARVPLLDHKLVEFAFSLPEKMRIKNGQSKWILRKVLSDYLPKELIDRPKMGFGIPLGDWLRSDFRDWAEDLLDKRKLDEGGYFSSEKVRQIWSEHVKNTGDFHYQLWPILMFQQWLERQK